MIQNYEITASFNKEVHKKAGSIESENGINKDTAEIMCEELKVKFPQYENFKFTLEGELIYEN